MNTERENLFADIMRMLKSDDYSTANDLAGAIVDKVVSARAGGDAEPIAMLRREIGETSWFAHPPIKPNSNEAKAVQASPLLDYCFVYAHPPAPSAKVPEGWDGEAYSEMAEEIQYWKTRALEADETLEKIRYDMAPTHMGEPVIEEVVYRWQALDYSGYCYGSKPPKELPERCNLTAFRKITAAPKPEGWE